MKDGHLDTYQSVADIFRVTANTEEFRAALIARRGRFSIAAGDIARLGEAYLERFPGCDGNENCDDVRDAYEVAKICVIEYLIAGFDDTVVFLLREVFTNINTIASFSNKLKSMIGPQTFLSLLSSLSSRAEALHGIIITLPASIIKERFSGALTFALNVIYLLGIEAGLS